MQLQSHQLIHNHCNQKLSGHADNCNVMLLNALSLKSAWQWRWGAEQRSHSGRNVVLQSIKSSQQVVHALQSNSLLPCV